MEMIQIKQASSSHYADIVRIYNQAIVAGSQTADEDRFSLQEKLPWFKLHTGDRYIIYVAEIENETVGYIALSPYRYGRSAFASTAEISYYVDKNHQGARIGTQLIQHALNQCPSLNIESLIAILLSCNMASIATLKPFNFKKWGCMPYIAKIKHKRVNHLYYGKHLR